MNAKASAVAAEQQMQVYLPSPYLSSRRHFPGRVAFLGEPFDVRPGGLLDSSRAGSGARINRLGGVRLGGKLRVERASENRGGLGAGFSGVEPLLDRLQRPRRHAEPSEAVAFVESSITCRSGYGCLRMQNAADRAPLSRTIGGQGCTHWWRFLTEKILRSGASGEYPGRLSG